MLTVRPDGHTWNEQPWGYAIRQCAIQLPCACQQQPARAEEAAATPAQTGKPKPRSRNQGPRRISQVHQ